MATPPPTRRISNENKKASIGNVSGVTTRNGARKAKIQTRAMSSTSKPSLALLAAKKKAQQKKRNSFEIVLRDHYQTAMDSKNTVRGEVGLILEPRMLEHKCLWDPNYPENPQRLSSIIKRCEELGLFKRCKSLQPRAATKEEILQLHSTSVYDLLLSTHQSKDIDFLEAISAKFDAIYIHPTTHELALIAAGSTIDLVSSIARKDIDCGIALVRPPGHHAMTAEPCGYCFYNNVALAAKHAITNCGLSRVLIVDWDVHHGQATQQMFYDDPRVVYFSIHRYEHGEFWPNLKQSDFHYVGSGAGTGFNFNLPLNKTKMQDSDYLAIWHQVLLPMAVEFQPQLIIVSAGYDAALGCLEGEMEVTPACYAHLTQLLLGVCSSMAVVLEGGYCPASLSEGAALTLRCLLGDAAPAITPLAEPSQSIRETILNCIYAHKPYWNCYNYQPTYSMHSTIPNVSDIGKEKHAVHVKWLGSEEVPDKYPTRNCYPIQSQKVVDEVHQRLNHLKITTNLSSPDKPCYVYDEAMLKHKNICEPGHVERPERLSRVHSRLTDWGLVSRLHRVASRPATESELRLAHASSLVTSAQATATSPPRTLLVQQQRYDSLYLHPDTYISASTAAGCVLQVVDSVLGGESRGGVCVVRPPGHHASEDAHCGFCIFNNVAVAAKYALSCHSLKRILIVDWDVHHGNGTQSIFLDDPRVLYISLHRYDHGTFFPHSKDGDHTKVGTGAAAGFNVNIPWNKRGMGDVEYLAAFSQVILPIAYEFNPELVIVSAGFDACIGDPLGGCKVTPECFGRMTHWLSGLAGGKLILCLEGGYNVTAISYAMAMCTKALLRDPLVHHYESRKPPHPSAVESINDVITTHKRYWKHICFQLALPKESILPTPEKSRGLIIKEPQIIKSDVFNKSEDDDSSFNSTDQNSSYESQTLQDSSRNDVSVESIIQNIDSLSLDSNSAHSVDNIAAPAKSESVEHSDCKKIVLNKQNVYKAKNVPDQKEVPSSQASDTQATGTSSHAGPSSSTNNPDGGKNQKLVDYLSENLGALLKEEMYAVVPLNWCPHVDFVSPGSSEEMFIQGQKCINCDHTEENWVCLHCFTRACGRYIQGHMVEHCDQTEHPLVLSLADLSVWCSVCQAYVDHPNLYPHRSLAHKVKFGESLPWSYGDATTGQLTLI